MTSCENEPGGKGRVRSRTSPAGTTVAISVKGSPDTGEEIVTLAGATANPCDDWLVPTGSVTGTAGASPAGSLVVSNPGSVQAEVEVDELTAASGSSPATLTTLVVGPGGTATATLHPTSGASLEGLEVRSSSPVVAEQDYHAASAIHALAVGPSPVVGVPVLR